MDNACIVNTIYRHIVETFNYIADPEGEEVIQTPEETIQRKGGDCEDLSILLISLLENVNISTYLVLTDTHAYALAYGINGSDLWQYVEQSLIDQVEHDHGANIHQFHNDTITLKGKQHWYYGGNGSSLPDYFEYLTFNFYINSTRSLDIYIVPSQEDFYNISDNKPFQYIPTCAYEKISLINDSCVLPDTHGGIIISNNKWSKSEVEIDIELFFKPSFYTLFGDNEIVTYTIDDVSCVVLDPTAGAYGFPGFDADIVGEKIALNPQTKTYVYLD